MLYHSQDLSSSNFHRFYLFLLAVLGIYLVRDNFFFWDTIQLGSKHAHYFYENGFQSLLLPKEIDSGHLPAFGMYLAVVWELFGKTLASSHFAMLPFVWCILYFLLEFGKKLGNESMAPLLVLLCFADPLLASQSLLISPDVALVAFFLVALHAIWIKPNRVLLAIAVAGLGMISMRGMMVGLGLYVFHLVIDYKRLNQKKALQKLLPYLPGGIIASSYFIYHWQQTGWIGYHPDSPWAPSFERVGLHGFLKNTAVLGWRMLDFGRIFVWAGLIFILWETRKLKIAEWRGFRSSRHLNSVGGHLVLLLAITALALIPSQLLHKGLLAHRYLMPVFFGLNFLLFWAVVKYYPGKAKALLLLLSMGLATGNFWVYPKKISMGWDSTLAHLPWYHLSKEMSSYLDQRGIAYHEVGTAFPNLGTREYIELDGNQKAFARKDLSTNCYVLYSNIMNDFTDEEIDELGYKWKELNRLVRGQVCVILYQNPNIASCEN